VHRDVDVGVWLVVPLGAECVVDVTRCGVVDGDRELVGAVGAAFLGFERGGDARVILSYIALLVRCFGIAFLALAAREP